MTLPAGIHPNFPISDYFADPCPAPSLTQSIAKILLSQTPCHAYLAHPRLNPAYQPEEDTKFNIGNAAHQILIGRGKEIVVIDADDWRTKVAKEARDEAHAAGQVAVLRHQFDTAADMATAAHVQLQHIPDACDAFMVGHGEVVAVAQRGPTWLRTMIDWMPDTTRLYDYKTTAASAHPDAIPARLADGEWPIQAAMQETILDILDPDNAGRRHHYFVCQETEAPYALTVSELPEATMTLGRIKLSAALATWERCMADNAWPMYGTALVRPTYPAWAVNRLMEQMGEE